MFRTAKDHGETDAELPGDIKFSLEGRDGRVAGWVSEAEFKWLCEKFAVPTSNPFEVPA